MSWLNSNSKQKIAYQTKRWGDFGCSYKWNEEGNCLQFNEEYFKKTGQPLPIIAQE
jgi:hypothetical protein